MHGTGQDGAASPSGFGGHTAGLVAAVTNPEYEPVRDEHQQYREHVTASLEASPWARVIKASGFTDYADRGDPRHRAEAVPAGAEVGPLVPVLRELILRPDTPLDADVKTMIAGQLDTAQSRFAAMWHGPDADGDQRVRPDRIPRVRRRRCQGCRQREARKADRRFRAGSHQGA
jgi:hypothetical protein